MVRRIWRHVVLLAIAAVTLIPFMLMVITSLKPSAIAVTSPPVWWFRPTLDNFRAQFSVDNPILLAMRNSIIVGLSATLLTLMLSVGTAYALTHYEFRGKDRYFTSFLALRAVPPIAFVLPYFLIWRNLHLTGTFVPLIVMYLTLCMPFAVWMMCTFMDEIPIEVEEAALLDGCSRWQTIRHVLAPLIAPGISATAGLSFILVWNEFLYALFNTTANTRTMPAQIYSQLGYFTTDWSGLSSVAVVSVIPAIVFVALSQRFIVRGLTGGAVKG